MSGLEIVEQQTDSEDDDDDESETDEEEPTEQGTIVREELTVDQILDKVGTLEQDIEEEDEEEEEQRVYAVESIQVISDRPLTKLYRNIFKIFL
jgi:hypothetical protein